MSKKLAILAIHGMGSTQDTFADPLRQHLSSILGSSQWNQIYFDKIYYQNLVQSHQETVWEKMRSVGLRWKRLRREMLFSFSDPATIAQGASNPESVYQHVQKTITAALKRARANLVDADAPIVIIAQSLGGHIISNYIWDAQEHAKGKEVIGTWHYDEQELLSAGSPQEVDFLRMRTLRFFFTTGCNIPLFVAGHKAIVAIDKPDPQRDFDWINFYDRDDILGWPLKPLSPSYEALVTEDVDITVGSLMSSWTPFSHLFYWDDGEFLATVATLIRGIL